MEYFLYGFLFITLYFQIFLLMSFFETEEGSEEEQVELSEKEYLSTTIIIPCFNEESTVVRTIESLLNLNYPHDKLTVMVVDDGSTDKTWEVVQQFKDHQSITLLQKQNEGSKFAALNFALQHIETELVGVLDADSWVDPEALKNYMYFFRDSEVMATIPSMVIAEPDSFLRKAQKAEYDIGQFARGAFSALNAVYIAPGPFSVFRKYVFDSLGPYKEAHHTEDAEIALRMQKHHYKIAYSKKSVVYTVGPKTLKRLYRQRIRWTYGFIKNFMDYRGLLFKKEYRALGTMVLPIGMFRIVLASLMFPLSLWIFFVPFYEWIQKIQVTGLPTEISGFGFDWFFIDVTQIQVFSFIALVVSIITIWIGREIVGDKRKYTVDIVYMLIMYTFIAPIWLLRSFYNALRSKKRSWY